MHCQARNQCHRHKSQLDREKQAQGWDLGRGKGQFQHHQQVHPTASEHRTGVTAVTDTILQTGLCTKPCSCVRNRSEVWPGSPWHHGTAPGPWHHGHCPREKAPPCPGAGRQWQIWFSHRVVNCTDPLRCSEPPVGTSTPLKQGLRLFNVSKEKNKARPKGRFTFHKDKRVPQGRVSSACLQASATSTTCRDPTGLCTRKNGSNSAKKGEVTSL